MNQSIKVGGMFQRCNGIIGREEISPGLGRDVSCGKVRSAVRHLYNVAYPLLVLVLRQETACLNVSSVLGGPAP